MLGGSLRSVTRPSSRASAPRATGSRDSRPTGYLVPRRDSRDRLTGAALVPGPLRLLDPGPPLVAVELERLAERHKVRLAYAADRFAPDHEGKPIRPAHSLHDAYLAADLITYPSLYEGFGNALLEAIYYGVPVLVNRYPVYVADIGTLGLRLIEIDGAITDDTIKEVRALLANPRRIRENARHNFEIARKHLSYRVLRRQLRRLIDEVTSSEAIA